MNCDPCARCGAPSALTAYWNDPLCRPCAEFVAGALDELDKWPAVPWTEDDEELTR